MGEPRHGRCCQVEGWGLSGYAFAVLFFLLRTLKFKTSLSLASQGRKECNALD